MYNNRRIWSVTYPILLGLLAQNIINVTDTAFLGRLGEIPLGASAMGGLLYYCIVTIAFGFSIGTQILIGRRNGESHYDAIGTLFWQGLYFSFVMSWIFLALMGNTSDTLLRLFISTDEVYVATIEFFDVRMWGILFSTLGFMFRAFYVGITQTRILTMSAVVMAVVNIVLDYAMIFGHWGFSAMGITGAAWASVIAEAVSLLFYVLYTYFYVDKVKYGLRKIVHIRWEVIGQILRISMFTMLQYFLLMSVWFIFFIAIEKHGSFSLAVSNIIRSLYAVVMIPIHALSTTANTLVSNLIGEGKTKEVLPLLHKITKNSVFTMCLIIAVFALFPRQIIGVYTDDIALIEGSVSSLYVLLGAMFIASISNIYFNGISGTGAARAALYIEIIIQAIYGMYIVWIGMWLMMPLEICFTTELLYYILMLVLSIIYLRRGNWRNKQI